MGERLRLRANFNTTTFSAPVKTILQALKTHGCFVADNGIVTTADFFQGLFLETPPCHAELKVGLV